MADFGFERVVDILKQTAGGTDRKVRIGQSKTLQIPCLVLFA